MKLCSWRGAHRAIFYPVLLLTMVISHRPVQAAEEPEEDFTELSLEELMNVQVVHNSVSALTSHIHKKGQWMVGYHLMYMDMDGNRDGTSDVSNAQVLTQFPVTPINMTMEKHMFSLMYAATDDLTVMAMTNYQRKNMDHVTRMGGSFSTSSDGIGDTSVIANYVAYRTPGDKHILSVKGGISFPTGSIDQEDFLPTGFARLPYPMQLGSGTYDVKLGGTYQYFQDQWSVGLNTMGTIRTGEKP